MFTDEVVGRDMLLACASAFITALAILVHTKSPFITGIGLMQIILSFPLSFFVYTFLGGLKFFPFLNFIGVFVVFALGADDIFVAVDKWKNARIAHPSAETAVIAAIALPDAAGAMFLTSFTTAIAFFGTAICPVAPVSNENTPSRRYESGFLTKLFFPPKRKIDQDVCHLLRAPHHV